MNEWVELTHNDLNIALKTAAEYYKGATRIGHALSKHAGRKPEIWGKIEGTMRNWHEQAMRHFKDIYHGPGKFVRVTTPKGIFFS